MVFTVNSVFVEGFDAIATADLAGRFDATAPSCTVVTGGRRGTGCASLSQGYLSPKLVKSDFGNQQDWAIQFALKVSAIQTNNSMFRLQEATSQIDLHQDASGHLLLKRGDGTLLGTSAAVFAANEWHDVELAVHIASGTSGWAILRVDGVTWLNLTGISTQATANAYAYSISTVGNKVEEPGTYQYVDDLYVRAGSGLTAADLYGDLGITCIHPTSDGVGANWTQNTGASLYGAVDDDTPNADTDYIESSTVGAEQRFGFGDIPAGVTVRGVDVACTARKTDAGARVIKFYVVTNGDTRYSAAINLIDTYRTYSYHWALNPVTAAAWTSTEVNAAEFGVRLDA